MLQDQHCGSTQRYATFGRRKVVPRVCVIDAKSHIRLFLRDALEDLGFVTGECDRLDTLAAAFAAQPPDIVVFGSSLQATEAAHILNVLAARAFDGWILLVAPRDSLTVAVVEELSNALHIAKLATLFTPFADKQLRECVAPLVPAAPPIDIPIDVGEALHSGWLELWYQPKIDTHTCCLRGAEALVRIRHPSWGMVPPAYFIPDDGDPHFRALSEFVISQALDDWRSIVNRHGPVEMAINLPISFLQDPLSIKRLCEKLPEHPAAEGLVIEINGTEVVRHFDLLKQMAKQLQFYRIAISIDDVGAEWPSLAGLRDFPFVEIKVDRKFITGCADDQLKQAVCRRILALADSYGARTVAEGVESRDDLQAVREMDFDLVQGFLFGRPMPAEKFVKRT